jgi:signal recognition particle GTPase
METTTKSKLGVGARKYMTKYGLNEEEHVSKKKSNVIVIMQGLPGSGKTTLVEHWIALNAMVHQLSPKKHFVVVSADD